MTTLTLHQEAASNPNATVWVGASAGTGKTHVLTARVLRLLLANHNPEKIVCLTYTKAAAAEMKNRIFSVLGRWVTLNDEKLTIAIYQSTGNKADADMLVTARQLFAEVLDLPAGLKIQTIHSFCQSILTRFPLEAKLMPGFEVVEEAGAAHLLRQAQDMVFLETGKQTKNNIFHALRWIATRTTEETFGKLMKELLSEANVLHRLFAKYGSAEAVTAALYQSLSLTPTDNRDSILKAAVQDDAFDAEGLRAACAKLQEGPPTHQKKGEGIAAFLASDPKERVENFNAYLAHLFTKDHKARADNAAKILQDDPSLLEVMKAEADRLFAIMQTLATMTLAENSKALLIVGFEIYQRYLAVKNADGKLDYDDIIDRTDSLLQQDNIAPWILYKLDGGIDHILVDEAQDTNKQQWQIIETLASEFYALEEDGTPARTLFAVGDPKQSIFSFQKADPREFIQARNRVFGQAKAAKKIHEAVPLDQSFRSSEAVLTAVDTVFDKQGEAFENLTFDDNAIVHKFTRTGQAGRVELWPLESPEEQEDDGPWSPPIRQETSQDTSERLATRVADHIKDLLDTAEFLPATKAPIQPRDIMILVQRREEFFDYLMQALRQRKIPVAGRDRMKLHEELPVEDLIALTYFALQPEDDLSLATVLKSPFIGMNDDDLFALSYDRDGSLWARLVAQKDSSTQHKKAYAFLRQVLQMVDQIPAFEFYSEILNTLGGRKKMVARLGHEVHDPLDEFLQFTVLFEKDNPSSLQGFLKFFKENMTEIKRDMEQSRNEIRIMTVHSAKGLQAPVVILPDTVRYPAQKNSIYTLAARSAGQPDMLLWKFGPSMAYEPHITQLKAEKESMDDAEYRRLLYVAMTRAEDRLIICGWETTHATKEKSWYKLVEKAFPRMPNVTTEIDGWGRPMQVLSVPQTTQLDRLSLDEQGVADMGILPSWAIDMPREEQKPARPLRPSENEGVSPPSRSPLYRDTQQRFHRGKIIHKLLEWLPEVDVEKQEAAALRYLSQPAHALPVKEQLAMWQEVKLVVNDPIFAPLFGPNSRAEVSLVGLVGEDVISGQVDRLVVTEDKVLVVDYKTNRPVPQRVGDIPKVYQKQMRAYARALADIYPKHSIEAAILWTDDARLMALPKDMLTE